MTDLASTKHSPAVCASYSTRRPPYNLAKRSFQMRVISVGQVSASNGSLSSRQQWGVVGTMARLNPLNLGRTVSTGATPAAQAAKQLIVPASKGAVVTGRDPLNLSVEDSE
jgi:hypothetical protein